MESNGEIVFSGGHCAGVGDATGNRSGSCLMLGLTQTGRAVFSASVQGNIGQSNRLLYAQFAHVWAKFGFLQLTHSLDRCHLAQTNDVRSEIVLCMAESNTTTTLHNAFAMTPAFKYNLQSKKGFQFKEVSDVVELL